jgi:hypothetical protein
MERSIVSDLLIFSYTVGIDLNIELLRHSLMTSSIGIDLYEDPTEFLRDFAREAADNCFNIIDYNFLWNDSLDVFPLYLGGSESATDVYIRAVIHVSEENTSENAYLFIEFHMRRFQL